MNVDLVDLSEAYILIEANCVVQNPDVKELGKIGPDRGSEVWFIPPSGKVENYMKASYRTQPTFINALGGGNVLSSLNTNSSRIVLCSTSIFNI